MTTNHTDLLTMLPTTAGCNEGNCVFAPSSLTNSEKAVEKCVCCGDLRSRYYSSPYVGEQGWTYTDNNTNY